MRVAIYIRVSTERQAMEGFSLDAQRKTLLDYCNLHNYTVYRVYADEGISGKDIVHRHAFKTLLEDAKQDLFDTVLVWKMTRFTRSLKDLISACDYLEKYGVTLISYSENIDTTTWTGRLMRNMLGVIAQWEREIIADNIRIAMAEKASQGYPICVRVLGYDTNGGKNLQLNKSESELVFKIFTEYIKLQNLSKVAEQLNSKGYEGKNGGAFTPQSILTILTNPLYCGYSRYHGKLYIGKHKSIIPVDTFNLVQKMIASNRKGRNRIHKLAEITTAPNH